MKEIFYQKALIRIEESGLYYGIRIGNINYNFELISQREPIVDSKDIPKDINIKLDKMMSRITVF